MNSRVRYSLHALAYAIYFSSLTFSVHAAGVGDVREAIDLGVVSDSKGAPAVQGPVFGRVIAENRLNVRCSPLGDIIGGTIPGAIVEILAREGEWYRIRYNKGVAYVHSSLVSIESGTPPVVSPTVKIPAGGIVTAAYRLNVRSSPWGEIIDGFGPGTRVEIVSCEGEWYIISHKGGRAFVHRDLVRIEDASRDSSILPASNATAVERPEIAVSGEPISENSGVSRPDRSIKPAVSTPFVPAVPFVVAEDKTVPEGGINGPAIPVELTHGLEAAKRSKWMASHKCLQFAGTVAHEAGAPDGSAVYYQPQAAWPADAFLRGWSIDRLPEAIEARKLLPGMLVHVKIHYDRDPAYHRADDAHHWFVYMGKDAQGKPRFADNTHRGNLQSAKEVYNNMRGWENSRKYGDSKYGYIPRVTAVHDPFASVR